jgi:hypothetical protein
MTDIARICELLHYDPETGDFTWRARSGNVLAGSVAGGISKKGYRRIRVDRQAFMAHRLAWLMSHGAWPPEQIDHINGCRDDNRISNLRLATLAENQQNVKKGWGKCPLQGIENRKGRFRAVIRASGKRYSLGTFDTPEEAAAAYVEAKRQLHTFSPELRP